MSFFQLIKDHSGCCILDQLQRLDSTCGKARQESITIVQSGERTRAWTRSCAACSDRKGLIFLMLYKALGSLLDLTNFLMFADVCLLCF